MQALRDLGTDLEEILEPAFTLSDADKRRLVQALKDAGAGFQEVLDGLLEVVGGAIFTVVAILLEVFGVFRPLTAAEKSRAASVFEDTVPLDDVQIFEGSFVSWAAANNTGEETGVTTMRIIHFPESYDPDNVDQEDWLIHELMHVWQGEHVGPVYMAHALIGQQTEGYDYGGDDGLEDHEDVGLAAFNPEQQASIIQDYYIDDAAGNDTSKYQVYIDEVRAA
jgi:hypothetical protein